MINSPTNGLVEFDKVSPTDGSKTLSRIATRSLSSAVAGITTFFRLLLKGLRESRRREAKRFFEQYSHLLDKPRADGTPDQARPESWIAPFGL
jgi:hypothetical protein